MALDLYGLGTRTRVTFSGASASEVEDAVRHAWVRCLAPIDPPDVETLDTEPLVAELADASADTSASTIARSELPALLQTLTQKVTYAKIRTQTGRLLMMHAGGVAHPETGSSIAFVAPGGTGKTTLMRRLGNRFGYLTDETVGEDDVGIIRAYPKPLSIRTAPTTTQKGETSPDDLRLLAAPSAPRLGRIVLLARSDDHEGTPSVEHLDLADAIAALAPETSALSSLPRPLHRLADLLGTLDPTVRLRYREVDEILDLVAGWLAP